MSAESVLLEVTDLDVTYRSSRRRRPVAAVRDAHLVVPAGQIHAIVGESGSGKSTFARAIVGLLQPDRGTIALAGEPLGPRRTPDQRRAVQMVFQDPRSSLNPRMRVRQIVAEAWETHPAAAPTDRDDGLTQLLEQVGLGPATADKRAGEMSGGQAQRVSLARALAVRPRLLVCDEAVSALDVSVQTQILRLLLDLRGSLGLSMLFITHDLGVVRQIADHITVMESGVFVEVGTADDVFISPQHAYTRSLLDAALDLGDAFGTSSTGGPVEAAG